MDRAEHELSIGVGWDSADSLLGLYERFLQGPAFEECGREVRAEGDVRRVQVDGSTIAGNRVDRLVCCALRCAERVPDGRRFRCRQDRATQ